MRAAAWAALAVVAAVACAAAAWGAFTRFGDPAPTSDPQEARRQQERQYDAAQAGAALGVLAAFLLLATAACGQRALRARRRP